MLFETFAPLAAIPFIRHSFSLRDPSDATKADEFEPRLIRTLGFSEYARAEQPHGSSAVVVEAGAPGGVAGVDALITRRPNLALLIRCADCAPVFIIDRRTPAIALVHSGKKGTIANITGNTVSLMRQQYNTEPDDCLAFIGPSIGPCHYEMDLWRRIESQLRDTGINVIENPRVCTACNLSRYYSYRAEHGQTGRMFAVLSLLQ